MVLASPRATGLYWGTDLVLLYNDAWRTLIGAKHPEVLGRPCREAFPEVWADAEPMFARVAQTGQALTPPRQRMQLRRDGGQLDDGWFSFTLEPVFEEDGRVVGVLNPAREVTDLVRERHDRQAAEARGAELEREVESQRRAALAAQAQDEHFRRIADASPALLWVTDQSGACTFLSRSWYDYTGTEPPDGLGFGWLDAVHPEDRARTRDAYLAALARREPMQLDHRLLRHDGDYRWALDSGKPRFDENGYFLGFVGSVIDIDDRKQVGDALLESEGRYAQLIAAVDEGFAVIEMIFDDRGHPTDYRFLEVNPAFPVQTGITDPVGRTMREIAPDHEEHWFEIYGRVAVTGEAVRFQAEGSALGRWFDVYAFRVGEPEQLRVALLFRDVTQRIRDEAALQASASWLEFRARLSDTLRNADNADEAETEASRLLGTLLRADRVAFGEVASDGTTARVGAEYRGVLVTESSPSIRGEHRLDDLGFVPRTPPSQEVIRRADVEDSPALTTERREIYRQLGLRAHVTVPLVRRGHLVAFFSVQSATPREWTVEEVALVRETAERTWTAIERSRAERGLRASEERFRRLADSMPQLVWSASTDGTVEYYNRRGEMYDGLVDGPDGTWEWKPILHPDDRRRTVAAWRRAVERGSPYECEHRVRMRDGTYRWHLSRAERVETDGIVQWYGTATDIHELKVADELKDRFLAIASHELRNPVGVIHGTAQQLKRARSLGTLSDRRFETYLDSLIETTSHLATLTTDLTDVSRLQRGALPLAPIRTDVTALLGEVTGHEEWAPRLRTSGLDEQIFAEVDPHRVRQVLINLIDNALKYSSPASLVEVNLRRESGGVMIEVIDQGIGLSPEDLQTLFVPFGRASNAGSVPGLGMGLFIAREIAERHGGDLYASSAGQGHGTKMSFWLPVTPSSQSEGSDTPHISPQPGAPTSM